VGMCASPLMRASALTNKHFEPTGAPQHVDSTPPPSIQPTSRSPSLYPSARPANSNQPTQSVKVSRAPAADRTTKPSHTRSPIYARFLTQSPSISREPSYSLHPSKVKTARPSTAPTEQPISIDERRVPFDSIASFNFSCFASCLSDPTSFDPSIFSTSTRDAACNFLMISVFGTCGTYSLADGTCIVPDCAKSCDAQTWCFYGTGAALFCPTINWNSESMLPLHLDMQRECLDNIGSKALSKQIAASLNNRDSDNFAELEEVNVLLVLLTVGT
jgi:hypothetical protein